MFYTLVKQKYKQIIMCASMNRFKRFLTDNAFVLLTMLGVGIGLIVGLGAPSSKVTESSKMWIGLPGELFLQTLKMLAVPLIVTSVVSETASMDPRKQGKSGLMAVAWIVVSNALGAAVGIAFGLAVQHAVKPEEGAGRQHDVMEVRTEDVFADLFRNFFPDNIVSLCFQQTQTHYKVVEAPPADENAVHNLLTAATPVKKKVVEFAYGANFLGIIIVSLGFGIAASLSGEEAAPFTQFFKSAGVVTLKLVNAFIWVTPVGAASLTAGSLLGVDDPAAAFSALALFISAVSAAICVHMFVALPALLFVVARVNPYCYVLKSFPAVVASVGASSSIAALPSMYRITEDEWGLEKGVTRLALPLTLTLGSSASGVFVSMACILFAKLAGSPLEAGQLLSLWILVAVLMMSLPSVPSSSLVVIVMLLSSFGVSPNNFALLFTMEWFSDRIRSGGNVISHIFTPVAASALSGHPISGKRTPSPPPSLSKPDESDRRRLLDDTDC